MRYTACESSGRHSAISSLALKLRKEKKKIREQPTHAGACNNFLVQKNFKFLGTDNIGEALFSQ